jgi:hypothetical protein
MQELVIFNKLTYLFIDDCLKNDRNFNLNVITQHPSLVELTAFEDNESFIIEILQKNWKIIKFLPNAYLSNKSFIQ